MRTHRKTIAVLIATAFAGSAYAAGPTESPKIGATGTVPAESAEADPSLGHTESAQIGDLDVQAADARQGQVELGATQEPRPRARDSQGGFIKVDSHGMNKDDDPDARLGTTEPHHETGKLEEVNPAKSEEGEVNLGNVEPGEVAETHTEPAEARPADPNLGDTEPSEEVGKIKRDY